MMFSIEAGRRCESGPGTFNFETKQSDEILRLVELAIRQQKCLSVSTGGGSPRSPSSPLPRRPISASLLDTQPNSCSDSESAHLDSGTLTSGAVGSAESACVRPAPAYRPPAEPAGLPEPVYSTPVNIIDSSAYSQPADVRSHQTVKNGRPTHLHVGYVEPVYADPVDVIRPNPDTQTRPAETVAPPIPSETSHRHGPPEPVYSEVLQVTPDSRGAQEEPIYSLPVFNTTPKTPEDDHSKTTVIYSQVNKPGKTTKSREKNTTHGGQDFLPESLGLI